MMSTGVVLSPGKKRWGDCSSVKNILSPGVGKWIKTITCLQEDDDEPLFSSLSLLSFQKKKTSSEGRVFSS